MVDKKERERASSSQYIRMWNVVIAINLDTSKDIVLIRKNESRDKKDKQNENDHDDGHVTITCGDLR